MVSIAYQISHDCTNQLATHILITRFTRQLKRLWDEHLTTEDKDSILNAIKIDTNGEPILQDRDIISDVVATLRFTIAKTFVSDVGISREKSSELLNKIKCKSLSDFRWYKNIFLTKIYARSEDNKAY